MTVGDLIEELQTLDPDKSISVSMPDPGNEIRYKGNHMGYERYTGAYLEINDEGSFVELRVDF